MVFLTCLLSYIILLWSALGITSQPCERERQISASKGTLCSCWLLDSNASFLFASNESSPETSSFMVGLIHGSCCSETPKSSVQESNNHWHLMAPCTWWIHQTAIETCTTMILKAPVNYNTNRRRRRCRLQFDVTQSFKDITRWIIWFLWCCLCCCHPVLL